MNTLSRTITFMLLLTLLVAATFRTTGLDYPVYLAEFLDPTNNLTSQEIGYVALITAAGQVASFWLVLLVSNLAFFGGHFSVLLRTITATQSTLFLIYLAYIGLFLIYGSPRRLIAYSLIVYVIVAMTFQPELTKRRLLRYAAMVAIASTFHASALVFAPFLIGFTYGRSLFTSITKLITLLFLVVLGATLLHILGVFDYILYKLIYYSIDAAAEQAYLEEVPSVWSGLLKRVVALGLLWVGTRREPDARRAALKLCLIEITLYGALGFISPVLAVTATYFAIGYLLPILCVQHRPGKMNLSHITLVTAAAVYYVPTSIGLIRLMGEFYVS